MAALTVASCLRICSAESRARAAKPRHWAGRAKGAADAGCQRARAPVARDTAGRAARASWRNMRLKKKKRETNGGGRYTPSVGERLSFRGGAPWEMPSAAKRARGLTLSRVRLLGFVPVGDGERPTRARKKKSNAAELFQRFSTFVCWSGDALALFFLFLFFISLSLSLFVSFPFGPLFLGARCSVPAVSPGRPDTPSDVFD